MTGRIPQGSARCDSGTPRTERQALASSVRDWLAVAEEALLLENDGKERAAVEKWRKLFGWRMPLP